MLAEARPIWDGRYVVFPKIEPGWWARATPLKNMSSSVGMIRNPIYAKIKNVPNHQPGAIVDLAFTKIFHGPRSGHFELPLTIQTQPASLSLSPPAKPKLKPNTADGSVHRRKFIGTRSVSSSRCLRSSDSIHLRGFPKS